MQKVSFADVTNCPYYCSGCGKVQVRLENGRYYKVSGVVDEHGNINTVVFAICKTCLVDLFDHMAIDVAKLLAT
jgi:hypothetical protein